MVERIYTKELLNYVGKIVSLVDDFIDITGHLGFNGENFFVDYEGTIHNLENGDRLKMGRPSYEIRKEFEFCFISGNSLEHF